MLSGEINAHLYAELVMMGIALEELKYISTKSLRQHSHLEDAYYLFDFKIESGIPNDQIIEQAGLIVVEDLSTPSGAEEKDTLLFFRLPGAVVQVNFKQSTTAMISGFHAYTSSGDGKIFITNDDQLLDEVMSGKIVIGDRDASKLVYDIVQGPKIDTIPVNFKMLLNKRDDRQRSVLHLAALSISSINYIEDFIRLSHYLTDHPGSHSMLETLVYNAYFYNVKDLPENLDWPISQITKYAPDHKKYMASYLMLRGEKSKSEEILRQYPMPENLLIDPHVAGLVADNIDVIHYWGARSPDDVLFLRSGTSRNMLNNNIPFGSHEALKALKKTNVITDDNFTDVGLHATYFDLAVLLLSAKSIVAIHEMYPEIKLKGETLSALMGIYFELDSEVVRYRETIQALVDTGLITVNYSFDIDNVSEHCVSILEETILNRVLKRNLP